MKSDRACLHSSPFAESETSAHQAAHVQVSKMHLGAEVNAWGAVRQWRTWYLAVMNMLDACVKYAIIFW